MPSVRWTRSLITRLALVGVMGGVALTTGVSWLEYRHARRIEASEAARRFADAAEQAPALLRPALAEADRDAARRALDILAERSGVLGVRLVRKGWQPISLGDWPRYQTAPAPGVGDDDPVLQRAFRAGRPTLFRKALEVEDGGRGAALLMLTDTGGVRRMAVNRALRNAATAWVVLGLLMLAGLFLLRTWLSRPLNALIDLAAADADAERFVVAAARTGGELGVLAGSIGGMLRRLDHANRELERREAELAHLYRHAPMAVLSIDSTGAVLRANDRAVEMFNVPDPDSLEGLALPEHIHPGDRDAFWRSVKQLEGEADARRTLRMSVGGRFREVDTHMTVNNAGGPRHEVRLSFADVTEARRIAREAEEQRRLLNLVIDHMGDCVLLASPEGRIISTNVALQRMIGVGRSQLTGHPHDPAALWVALEPLDAGAFERKVDAAAADPARPFEGRFECAVGAFEFQAKPVKDEEGELLAQLWVVRDVSDSVQLRQLLDRQEGQLRALRRVGRELQDASGVVDLMERSVRTLREVVGVEAGGVAIRGREGESRCHQLLDDGQPFVSLAAGQGVQNVVSEALMPRMMAATDSSFWPDLSVAGDWAAPMARLGVETLAVTPLKAGGRIHGVAWIGRRGGRRIDPHQLYVLEAMTPILSTALQAADLRDNLRAMAMTDPLTDLPAFAYYDWLARGLAARRAPWALLMVDIDRFNTWNERIGLSGANELLRGFADLLRGMCRSNDQPIRHSADKFLVVCPAAGEEEAACLAERICRTVAESPLAAGGESFPLTCSIGVAAGCGPETTQTLPAEAERRLRLAQSGGRNRVVAGGSIAVDAAG